MSGDVVTPPDDRELRRLRTRVEELAGSWSEVAGRASAVLAEATDALARRSGETRAAAEDDLRRQLETLERTAATSVTAAGAELQGVLESHAALPAAAGWTTSAWSVAPDRGVLPPELVRVGTARVAGAPSGELPVLVPGLGVGHVHLLAPAQRRTDAVGIVEGVLLRLLAGSPAGEVRFRVFDPVGLGSTLSPFSRFDQERIARGTPATGERDLAEELERLSRLATDVSSSRLQGRYPTLRAYVEAGVDADVGFEVLVLLDAPAQIDERLAADVARLAVHAASRGIMLVVHQDSATPPLDLGPEATVVRLQDDGTLAVPSLGLGAARPDQRVPSSLIERVAARPVEEAPALLFEALQPPERFAERADRELRTAVGRRGTETVDVVLGDEPPHGLVAGDTGSGKSNLMRVLIYGLARRYPAEDVQMYLLDFKEGVEFQEFAPTTSDQSFLPHAAVVSVNSSREFGVEVLRHVNELVAERYALFSDTPGDATKLEKLRPLLPDEPLPRILLVVDEFQRLFDVDDELARTAAAMLVNIAKQGRAAGVHFLLATQSLGDVGVGTSVGSRLDGVFKNARLRIGMRLNEQESRTIFQSVDNTAAAELHERGAAIVNHQSGATHANVRTRVAYLSDDVARAERREAVSRTTTARRPPRVFDGARGADPALNRRLRAALRGRREADGGWRTWVGESLRLAVDDARSQEGTATRLTRDADRNLAVVGTGMRTAMSILQWATIGLAVSDPRCELLLVDLLRPEDAAANGVPRGLVEATAAVARSAGASVRVLATDEGRAVVAAMRDLAEGGPEDPAATVLFGADRLGGLDEPVDPADDAWNAPTVGAELSALVVAGARRRTHTFGSWATVHAYGAVEPAHRAFGMRAYLRMGEMDLRRLSDSDQGVADAPLALWHDAGRGEDVQVVHSYEPFGLGGAPGWLS